MGIGYSKMWMKSLNITLGTVFKKCVRFKNGKRFGTDLEATRYRKKPPGGSRFLSDPKQLYLFNAWY